MIKGIGRVSLGNGGTDQVTLQNVLVRGTCEGKPYIVSHGGNLESPGNTCNLAHPTDQATVADPGIGGLSGNGGATLTHALLCGSPAIDRGVACPTAADQRGSGRPVDGDNDGLFECDVGAYELGQGPTCGTSWLDYLGL